MFDFDYKQDDLVEFWTYQMQVHHPRGAKTAAEGAYAADWEVWKVGVSDLSKGGSY